MRRIGVFAVVLMVLVGFIGTVLFLYFEAVEPEVVYTTATAKRMEIVKKTVATGSLVPRNEVELKSRVSGILDSLSVEPGDRVEAGDLIARVRVVPQPQALERATSALKTAKLNLREAIALLEEDESLYESQALPLSDLERRRVEVARREEQVEAARRELTLIREGALRNAEAVATDVRSTVSGMVLDVPVRVGVSITETNTFNAGTTIAMVADMSDMVFEGFVDESEVGKVAEGMPLRIMVGAMNNAVLDGELEHIAPKGQVVDGAVQFAIRAKLSGALGDRFVRAGSSANADIVLDKRADVLSIPEALLHFEGGKPHVYVEVGEQQFELRPVTLGLSDGLNVEVVEGVTAAEQLRGRVASADASKKPKRGR